MVGLTRLIARAFVFAEQILTSDDRDVTSLKERTWSSTLDTKSRVNAMHKVYSENEMCTQRNEVRERRKEKEWSTGR